MSRYTLQELEFLSMKLSKNTTIVNKVYKGRPDELFPILLKGNALGFDAVESVQSIMVINGKLTMWGDALPALALNSGEVEKLDEKFEGEYPNLDYKAVCTIKRKGMNEKTVTFSLGDAHKAKLWVKDGVGRGQWGFYTNRMLQIRARSFCLRDTFADKLKGLIAAEEALDYRTSPNAAKQRYTADINKETQPQVEVVSQQEIPGAKEAPVTKNHEPELRESKNALINKLATFIKSLEARTDIDITETMSQEILDMVQTIAGSDNCNLTELQLLDRATLSPDKFLQALDKYNGRNEKRT